jgi:EAL domain-containing protein (putative c-di-GMP-specific phosphodiesterase class I)
MLGLSGLREIPLDSQPAFSVHTAKTVPPASNRLSDAPSADDRLERHEMRFFDGLVRPRDLSVVFQPIVRLDNGRLFAYEALVRCQVHSLSPVALFERAAAEHSTGRLGRIIREIAVPMCSGIPLFVNLHPTELEDGWLVRPDDPIVAHDHDIYLEITESAPLTHFDLCLSVLREVCSRVGAHLVVDDFGAGYSNLKRISDLEPRVVKLDRALVANLDKKPRQQRLVSATVRLCEQLGAVIVAEGVETPEEFMAVRDAGAHYGQGYLFARPGFPLPTVSWPPQHSQSKIKLPSKPPPSAV